MSKKPRVIYQTRLEKKHLKFLKWLGWKEDKPVCTILEEMIERAHAEYMKTDETTPELGD